MDEIKDLIDKFWAGTATAEEKERLHSFLKEYDPEWELMLESDYGQADLSQMTLSNDRMDQLLGQLHVQIGEQEIPALPEKKVVRISSRYKWVAAAILLLIAGAGMLQWWHTPAPKTMAVQQQTTAPATVAQVNNSKNTSKILLADGSTVLLHPGGRIVYHKSFGTLDRSITLEGAAQFKVAQRAGVPFKVYTDGLVTTALGTEFLIRKSAQGAIVIRLITGKVVVQEKQHSFLGDTYLTIGQELTVNAHTRQFALTTPRNAAMPARREDHKNAVADNTVMEFNKTPLTRVFDRLGSFYGKQIRYHNTRLHHLSFTGTFGQKDSLQTALTVICNMNNLVFTVEQDTIYINR